MDDSLIRVQQALGYEFLNLELLEQALTHPSFVTSATAVPQNNQRLEFLGDAVLQLVSTDLLYRRLPELQEGRLTKLRSALTNEQILVRFANAVSLRVGLRLGKGEVQSGGHDRASTLADAFEAILGAMYLDGGMEPVQLLCRRLMEPYLADMDTLLARENPKGALQEYTQEHVGSKPEYDLMTMDGPGHQPEIEVRVSLDGEELARGKGGSRRQAERDAARRALLKLQETSEQ